MKSTKLLRNSSFIFALSIALGLIYPGPAHYSEALITPALMLMMAFSTTEIDLKAGLSPKGPKVPSQASF